MGIGDYHLQSPPWDYWCRGLTLCLFAVCLGVSSVRLIVDTCKIAIDSNLTFRQKILRLCYFLIAGISLLFFSGSWSAVDFDFQIFDGFWDFIRVLIVLLTCLISLFLFFLSPLFGGLEQFHAQLINSIAFLGSSILIAIIFIATHYLVKAFPITAVFLLYLSFPVLLLTNFQSFPSFSLLTNGAFIVFAIAESILIISSTNSQKDRSQQL
jgi:hypothetical protein